LKVWVVQLGEGGLERKKWKRGKWASPNASLQGRDMRPNKTRKW